MLNSFQHPSLLIDRSNPEKWTLKQVQGDERMKKGVSYSAPSPNISARAYFTGGEPWRSTSS